MQANHPTKRNPKCATEWGARNAPKIGQKLALQISTYQVICEAQEGARSVTVQVPAAKCGVPYTALEGGIIH